MVNISERWLPVVGYEGIYEVSDKGRVKRILGGQGATKGRILKQTYSGPGKYLAVNLSRDNVSTPSTVHRLVLSAFVGECPEGMEACHNDDDPTNNRLDNLRWDTHRNNCKDRSTNGKPVKEREKKTHCRRGHEYRENSRDCLTCRKNYTASYRNKIKFPDMDTKCRAGHIKEEVGVYVSPDDRKQCVKCRSLADNRRKLKRRALKIIQLGGKE